MSVMFNMFTGDDTPIAITAGTPVVVDAGRTAGGVSAIIRYSDTQALAFWDSQGGGSTLYQLALLTVSGTTITVGTPTTIYNSGAAEEGNYGSIAQVTSNNFVVGYGTNKAMIVTVSGSSVAANTQIAITNAIDFVSVGQLDTSNAIVAYQGTAPNYAAARVLSVSGTTLSANTEYAIDTNVGASVGVGTYISASQYLSRYTDGTNAKLMVLDISGTAITTNTSTTITNAVTNMRSSSIAINNSAKATTVYSKTSSNGIATRAVSISGSTTSIGSETVIDATGVGSVGIIGLTTDTALAVYGNSTSSGESVVIGSITPLTAYTSTQYDAGAVARPSVCALTATLGVVLFTDQGNSNQITACALRLT